MKLQNLGSQITNKVEEVGKLFDDLYKINSMNIILLRLQGNYLKYVIRNVEEAQKIIDKEIQISKRASSKFVNLEE